MKAWQRTLLFFTLFLIFLTFGPILVLYSLGWRFDFEKKKFSLTGGIFVKAKPSQVKIFLNDKYFKSTDRFFGSALIQNLLPRKYKVRIEKENYFSWEKELEVKENEVTEIKNLILFPKTVNFSPLFREIEDFWISPSGEKIVLKEKEGDSFSLKIYFVDKKLKSFLLSKNDFSEKEKVEILNLKFQKEEKEIEIEAKIGEEIKSFYFDLEKNKKLEKEKPTEVLCFKEKEGKIYFLEKTGFLFLGSINFEKIERLSVHNLPIEKKCELEILGNEIFLIENGNFYLFNPLEKVFEKYLENTKGWQISPQGKKILIFTENEVWIFPGKIFLNRFSEKIENALWLNEDYLILKLGKEIKILETDVRDKLNIFSLFRTEEKVSFNPLEKKIYWLKGNILTASDAIF